ncbi:MAG: polyprenyl synthetase family protein [Candidatus Aminicenantes bacterium]|nr:polyprenyl synthetase family protein [Candidatus Aminicenantes bacterium]
MKPANESPHLKTPLEWWFFHGFYRGSLIDRQYFMVSLFRQRMEKDGPDREKHVFYIIMATTDPKNHSFQSLSQIHKDVLDAYKDSKNSLFLQNEQGNLDPILFKTYVNELKTYGPPAPIEVKSETVHFQPKPFFFQWDDFSLEQKQQSFILTFKDPLNKKRITIECIPLDEVVHVNDYGTPHLETTYYNSYPRMKLSGSADSDPIQGYSWLDHQWGDFKNWFFSSSHKKRYMGWDWMGINLNDDTDIILTTHRDMEKNKIIDRVSFYGKKGSVYKLKLLDSAEMKPTEYWKSPRTNIIYPVGWKIDIPELDTEFEFIPFVKEQEIPIFGNFRAIWEGAGKVRGIKKGKKISGLARLELHGYGYLFDFKKYLQNFSDDVDKEIESFFPKKFDNRNIEQFTGKPQKENTPEALTSVLSEPVWDIISRKGKRWRPLFGLLALESLGVNPEPYKRFICCTMELNHTGALIIDDIEDDSLIRRGKECVHIKYGEDIAINAGCTLYFLPYLLIEKNKYLKESQKRKLYEVVNNVMIRAHFGQSMDIFWSKNLSIKNYKIWSQNSLEDKILQMYAYKTGAAVEGGGEAACIIAETDENIYKSFKSMALAFGVAFQIIDDIHNFSNSSEWTKKTGEDISSGKLTYVIHKAIQKSNEKDAQTLLSILCSKKKRNNPDNLKTAARIVRKAGVLSSCKEEAINMIESEWKNFSEYLPMTEAKIQIKLMITGLLNFDYET